MVAELPARARVSSSAHAFAQAVTRPSPSGDTNIYQQAAATARLPPRCSIVELQTRSHLMRLVGTLTCCLKLMTMSKTTRSHLLALMAIVGSTFVLSSCDRMLEWAASSGPGTNLGAQFSRLGGADRVVIGNVGTTVKELTSPADIRRVLAFFRLAVCFQTTTLLSSKATQGW